LGCLFLCTCTAGEFADAGDYPDRNPGTHDHASDDGYPDRLTDSFTERDSASAAFHHRLSNFNPDGDPGSDPAGFPDP
jgi:hypothetical protein